MANFGEFLKPKACGQTVLPVMAILTRKKLIENAKIEKIKCDILGDFQTMCHLVNIFSPFISISILALVIGSMVETNHDRR